MKINNFELVKELEPEIRTNGEKRRVALFRCTCGDIKKYHYSAIKSGHTKQCMKCGIELSRQKRTTHGLIKHPLYRKWQDMKKRCYNPNVERYKSYGALGITVCEEWRDDFMAFYNWCMSNGFDGVLQLDRKDVYGNYCPENCQFISAMEQGFNKRNTFYVTIKNKKYSLAKLCYVNKSKKYQTIWHGLRDGKTIEELVVKYNINVELCD